MLELLGVWVLKAPTRGDVGVVHDNVDVRDMPGVVVVVDDGHLVVAEVLARPGDGELAEVVQPHVVFGIWREHVVFVGAAGPASPGSVVSPARARGVHRGCPVEGISLAFGHVEVQVVGGERPSVLGEVAEGAPAGRVAGYGLEQRHGQPPTGRAGATPRPRARVRQARPSSHAGAQAAGPPRRAPPGRRMRPWPRA